MILVRKLTPQDLGGRTAAGVPEERSRRKHEHCGGRS